MINFKLKSMPKGSFVVMKTGTHPMKTKLKMEARGRRPVRYAGKADLEMVILKTKGVEIQ